VFPTWYQIDLEASSRLLGVYVRSRSVASAPRSFGVSVARDGGWEEVWRVSDNAASELFVRFPEPVVSDAVRLTIDSDNGNDNVALESVYPIADRVISGAAGPLDIGMLRRLELHDLLADRLWTPRDAADASDVLMLPMHDAFLRQDRALLEAFRGFFRAYLDDAERPTLERGARLRFLQLASRFAALEARSTACTGILERLLPHLAGELERVVVDAESRGKGSRGSVAFTVDELAASAAAADLAIAMPSCDLQLPEVLANAAERGQHALASDGAVDVIREGDAVAHLPRWSMSLRCAADPASEHRARLDAITAELSREVLDASSVAEFGRPEPGEDVDLGGRAFLGRVAAASYAERIERLSLARQTGKSTADVTATPNSEAGPDRHPAFVSSTLLRSRLYALVLHAAERVALRPMDCP
jgi:hypothetical protein